MRRIADDAGTHLAPARDRPGPPVDWVDVSTDRSMKTSEATLVTLGRSAPDAARRAKVAEIDVDEVSQGLGAAARILR